MNHVRLVILAGAVLALLGSRVEAQTLSATLKTESVASLAKAALEQGDAVRGAILFPQQKPGCANCHTTGAQNLLGPDLSRMGDEATGVYLVEAMLYPSKVIKKGFESSTVATVAGRVLGPLICTYRPVSSSTHGGEFLTFVINKRKRKPSVAQHSTSPRQNSFLRTSAGGD